MPLYGSERANSNFKVMFLNQIEGFRKLGSSNYV
jgi:hypothetical protein